MRSLADYAAGVAEGWSEDTLARMFIHDLPRAFHEEGVEIHRRLFPESRKDAQSLMADALGAQAKP